jgi:hypothetical protein
VQGIRDLAQATYGLNMHNDDVDDASGEGYYLNRANDGFLYFDSEPDYSCGTVNDNDKDKESLWITSLTFGKSRLILAKNLNGDQHALTRLLVSRKQDPLPDRPSTALVSNEAVLQQLPRNIIWQAIIRCRMPSTSHIWTAKRLKWETCLSVPKEDHNELGHLQTWALRMQTCDEPIMNGVFEDFGDSYLLCAGGVSSTSGFVKCIARQYSSSDGSLKSVVWLRGRTTGTARQQ